MSKSGNSQLIITCPGCHVKVLEVLHVEKGGHRLDVRLIRALPKPLTELQPSTG